MPNALETRPWTCPSCGRTWVILREEPPVPQDPARCPDCSEGPQEFTPGQVVRVSQANSDQTRLGVVDEAVQAARPHPEDDELTDDGPYTGEYMVWHVRGGADPGLEERVFRNLPHDPGRRRELASLLFTGVSVPAARIAALAPKEQQALLM